jgi:hypothetical protein
VKRLLVALIAVVVGLVAVLALAGGTASSGARPAASSPPDGPQCDADDQVLAMEVTRSGRGEGSSPEDAVEREVHTQYPNLPPSAFRRSRQAGNQVELVAERQGRKLVVVQTEEVDGGWGVERLVACNKVLTERGGRER